MIARLEARVEERRAAAVGFLCDLIRAGREGEADVQALFAARARDAGGLVETRRYHPGDVPMHHEFADPAAMSSGERCAVLVRRPGSGGGRSLVIFAHPDSEPPVDAHGWSHDPFVPKADSGRLHGWGIADDLAGIACMVEALAAVASAGIELAGDVTLASTPSKRHARGVCALLAGGLRADAALYLHPAESGAGMREIKACTPGQAEFEITITGQKPPTTEPLPAAFAHRAVNPIEKAFVVHEALRDLDRHRGERTHHPLLDAAVGRATNLMMSHITSGDPRRLSQMDATCLLGGVLAFPPGETLESVQGEVMQALNAAVQADPWLASHPPDLAWRSGTTGAELPETHPLYALASSVIQSVTGEPPALNALHTGSDIRHPMVQRGIPTIGLGPRGGALTQNGQTGEWVDVDDYIRSVKVVAGIIAGWCR